LWSAAYNLHQSFYHRYPASDGPRDGLDEDRMTLMKNRSRGGKPIFKYMSRDEDQDNRSPAHLANEVQRIIPAGSGNPLIVNST
jgi:hypothetical protein